MQKVFVIQAMGIRQAGLMARLDYRGGTRCKVRIQGARMPRLVDPALVFGDAEAAREAWRDARRHRQSLEKAGRHLTVTEAALDLARQLAA